VEDKVANGFRTGQLAVTSLLAALLALCIGASAASAAPLSMQFTEARANVGVQLDDEALFAAPATAPFEAQIDSGGLISEGALQVPQFSTVIATPIDASVTVTFDIGEIEGSFNQATGALSLSGTAAGTLTAVDQGECFVSVPDFLTLTTAGTSGGDTPRSGTPFANGLTGAGAIAGTWDDMIAEPVTVDDVSFCNNVQDYIGGPGGIWLQHQGDIVPPAAPQLTGTDPASPAQNGTPRILGAAEAGSSVRLFAAADCTGAPVAAGSAAELASPGLAVSVAEGATAAFSATATDAAGNTSPCSAPISYTHTKRSTPIGPPKPPVKRCVVPKLAGKTLKQAKRALKTANCKLGKVTKPKPPKGNKAKGKKGKKQPVLVVKRSTPRQGAKPASGKVNLTLKVKPKPRKARG
jgi:hypothetical protein